jgi:hypothetical protein
MLELQPVLVHSKCPNFRYIYQECDFYISHIKLVYNHTATVTVMLSQGDTKYYVSHRG